MPSLFLQVQSQFGSMHLVKQNKKVVGFLLAQPVMVLLQGEEVLVIGGGDSACEEATFLTRFASKVTLIHRRDVFKASTIMYERAANNDKIEIRTFRQVKEWLSDENGLTGAVLEDPRDGSTEEISATGPSLL